MKTNRLKFLLVVSIVVFFFGAINAQTRVVQGLVTTFDSLAIIGADVVVKSSSLVCKTDSLGRFEVEVLSKDKLKISAKGFMNSNVKIGADTKFIHADIKLKPGEKSKEYAIGYGYVNDAEKLNSLSQMSSDDVDFSQYTDMYQLIQGRFSGVEIVRGEIVIRGSSSINNNGAALIVVNGVQSNSSVLGTLMPTNVSSISVIKDSGAAIYGGRGAHGVVVIETKKGGE